MDSDPIPDGPAPDPRPRWLWPFRIPARIARYTHLLACRLADRLGSWHRWVVAGLLIGAIPCLLDYASGCPCGKLLTALLLTPVLVAAVVRDALGKGLGAVAAAFLGHSAVFIALASSDPDRLAGVMPQGLAYWHESQRWIVTGLSPEYDLNWWLPAHVQWFGVIALFTYLSLGLVTFWQGLFEVDLMNFYVGQLLVHSSSPLVALGLGWHPWSLCRALGYLFITFEVTSLSCQRLTGMTLSTPGRRSCRWVIGVGFLLLDGLLKFVLLDTVRTALAGNLD